MSRILSALVVHLGLAALGLACSSVEKPAVGGTGGSPSPAGIGGAGGAGPDTSCIDGSDGCVWSCAAGWETRSGDSPQPFCDSAGKFRCPIGSQPLSSCAPGSCARFDRAWCCDPATGHVDPPPCKVDGFRDVCPPGSSASDGSECIPAGLGVSECGPLDMKSCSTVDLECHGRGQCRCKAGSDGALVWDCHVILVP
jgi:hypothetical protein